MGGHVIFRGERKTTWDLQAKIDRAEWSHLRRPKQSGKQVSRSKHKTLIIDDTYGALASATIYTLLRLVILACNRERVDEAFRALTNPAQSETVLVGRLVKVAISAIALMAILFGFDQLLVNLFGHGQGVTRFGHVRGGERERML